MMQDVLVGLGLLVGLVVALELGFRAGRRAKVARTEAPAAQLGAVEGAVLGLLALLLGFSFAGAASRFIERQDLIVREANAIGTANLRADLLEADARREFRSLLKAYTEHRIAVADRGLKRVEAADLREVDRLQSLLWRSAVAGVSARPTTTVVVIPAVNEVIDLHSLRIAAGRKHLPLPVLALLVSCSGVSLLVLGYWCGLSGRRNAWMTAALAFLIAASLWITIDLDHPRAGLIQLDDWPLRALTFEPTP